MAVSTETVLITVVAFLIAIIILISSAIVFIFVKVRKKKRVSTRSFKGKKPSLKLNITKSELPLFKEEAPSPAYNILAENQKIEQQHATFPVQVPVPTTPETPGFIQTPGPYFTSKSFVPMTTGYQQDEASSQIGMPFYERSVSVPGESEKKRKQGQGEVGPSLLWRNAMHKATRLNVLDLQPKKPSRISVCPQGKISFTLIFNSHFNELHVRILRLIDLPLTRESGLSYPFIKISFLLHDAACKSTPTEILSYPKETSCSFSTYSFATVRKATLKFLILEYDRFSRTEFMGSAMANLADMNLDGAVESRHLQVEGDIEEKQAGLLLISLCYLPNNNSMSMVILRASDLPDNEGHGKPDYFVKITLLRNNKVMDKRRTKVAKKSSCPHFNERLSFPCEESAVKDISFVFDVVRYESRLRQEKNYSVGNVVLGNSYLDREVGPLELHHFHEMLNSPQRQVSEWHRVIPLN